jgi:hypothetical protein
MELRMLKGYDLNIMAKDGFTEKVFLYEVQKGMREQ